MPRKEQPPRLVKLSNRENWYIRHQGNATSTGTTDRAEAEQWLASYVNAQDTPQSDVTIVELLDRRMEYLQASEKSRFETAPYFHKQLRIHFGNLRPDQITPSRIFAFRIARKEVPGALREELIELRTALNYAAKRKWITSTPDIDIPAKRPPRERFMSKEEFRRLLEAAGAIHLKLFILIAGSTAARSGAITGLTWDRVNFDTNQIDFHDPNRAITNKRRAVVPVDQTVMDILREAKRYAQTGYVIEYSGKPVASVKKSFKKACQKARLEGVSPHILKHTAISWLAEAGHSVDDIADMTQTTPAIIRRVYRKIKNNHLTPMAKTLAPSEDIVSMFTK